MATQIRPTRLEVSDRFPMLGFTVRTDGAAKRFEIAVGTSPDLFRPESKGQRDRHTFYSSRVVGPLPIERGEAVYVLPSEVLARFVGQQKLYYGLATFSNGNGSPEIVSAPKSGSTYINISGLTGRSLQRVRVLPNRQRAASTYGKNGSEMEWAGDVALPGTQPTVPSPTAKAPEIKTAEPHDGSVHYDDGYGPLPPSSRSPADKQPQAKSLADDSDQDALHGIEGPIPDGSAAAQSLSRAMALDSEYPQASRFAPANAGNYRAVSGTRKINRIVVHITDGGANINGTIGWFQNAAAKVSAHYVVGQDGEVVQMVRNNDVAWHASSANGDSIGIEHVANTRGLKPTAVQYCASAALVNWLCTQFNLPMDRTHVLGHSEADPKTSHTGCPNAVWDWDYYMPMVTSATCDDPTAATASALGFANAKREPQRSSAPRATALRQVDSGYAPGNSPDALQAQKQFQDRKTAWAAGVPDTTFFPHSAICQLRMTMEDGSGALGSGAYIAADRILTCGHNLAGATSVTVIPGKNDTAQPFGSFNVSSSDWVIHPKFDVRVARSSPTGHDFDLAVIKVSTPPPNGQVFDILEELLQCQDSPIIVCGYAAETVNRDKQHLDGDAIRLLSDSGEVFMYNLQTDASARTASSETLRRNEGIGRLCLVGRSVDRGCPEGHMIASSGNRWGLKRTTSEELTWINSPDEPSGKSRSTSTAALLHPSVNVGASSHVPQAEWLTLKKTAI